MRPLDRTLRSLGQGQAALVGLFLLSLGAVRAAQAPKEAQIRRSIVRLGAETHAAREEASRFLWGAGPAAEPFLEAAARSDDPEVATRAKDILEKVRVGILPDTPPDLIPILQRYRDGDDEARSQALHALVSRGHPALPSLLALHRREKDENRRRFIADRVTERMDLLLRAGGAETLRCILPFTEGEQGAPFRERIARPLQNWLQRELTQSKFELVPVLLSLCETDKGGWFEGILASSLNNTCAQAMIRSGDLAHAERVLELLALTDYGAKDYAVFLTLTGKLPEAITRLTQKADGGEKTDRLLATFHRMAGNLDAALASARKLGQEYYDRVREDVLIERGDWAALSEMTEKQLKPDNIESLGYRAAYARLSSNQERFQETVRLILDHAKNKPEDLLHCCEALLINEQFELVEGIGANLGNIPAFDYFRCRLRYDQPFRLAAAHPGNYFLQQLAALCRYRLGERQEALADLARGEKRNPTDDDWPHYYRLVDAAKEAGLHEHAMDHALEGLARGGCEPHFLLYGVDFTLVPDGEQLTRVWQQIRGEPGLRPQELSQTLRKLAKEPSEAARKLLEELAAAMDKGVPRLKPDEQAVVFELLGELCERTGHRELAQPHFRRSLAIGPSAQLLLHLGDQRAAEGKWEEAAELYRKAWEPAYRFHSVSEAIGRQAESLYLQGWALQRAGKAEEARRLIQLSRLYPLGGCWARYVMGRELYERGHREAGIAEFDFIQRMGRTLAAEHTRSRARIHLISDAISRGDYETAARYQEQTLLLYLWTSWHEGAEWYLNQISSIHTNRARSLLAKGRVDDALREADLALKALPGDVGIPIALVPELEKRGQGAAADRLFAAVLRAHQDILRRYPNAAEHHQQLAKLYARCNRNLDLARDHAQRAMALEPDLPASLSARAEVEFHSGHREEAVELVRRCIERRPQDEDYREQLRRFTEAPR
jgi:tetratricopeptide (TPR) repeat protein